MGKLYINLIPDDIQREWRIRSLRKWLIIAGAAYLAFLGFVFLSQRGALSAIKAEEAALMAERDAITSRSSSYAELAKKLRDIQAAEGELKKRLGVAADLKDKRVSWSTVLKKLSHGIPEGVWLRSLSTTDSQGSLDKKLRFLGSATTNRAVADFIFTLENSGHLQNVTLSYTQKKDFASTTVYDFEIYATLKKTDEVMYEW